MTTVLALHDGHAGNARQVQALANALDLGAVRDSVLQPGLLAHWMAPRSWPLLPAPFGRDFRAICGAPPALAIGCGRQAALATRLLRERGSKAVQLLDPRIDPRHWDLVVVPEHDDLRGGNVIPMRGSLHPVDDLWLARARDAAPMLAQLPAPRTVLLVGGSSRHAPLDDESFERLLQQLSSRAIAEHGSFSAVASRRTPAAWRAAIGRIDASLPGIRWRDEADGGNPYAGLLAHAQRIVCTPDSVNMLSEAAATLAPAFAWSPTRVGGRVRAFVDALLASGRLRVLDDALAGYPVEPLRETARVAAEVRQRLASITR